MQRKTEAPAHYQATHHIDGSIDQDLHDLKPLYDKENADSRIAISSALSGSSFEISAD